jgi:hypothetical protein
MAGASLPHPAAQVEDPPPPDHPVRLVFVHHSTGEAWLADEHGGLGRALSENNYFVSDTNYGWGPEAIGDRTDIPNWLEWFAGPDSGEILAALYGESEQHAAYTRTLGDPGGENEIVLFKSCFPNSNLTGNPTDPASPGEEYSVGHAKYVYNEILQYFATRPDKLFVVITAPPVQDPTYAENARAFNTWLVEDWLQENEYPYNNVAVFDFYNVLTGPDNHHRYQEGAVEHVWVEGRNTSYYPSSADDDHPSAAGDRKATQEFVPLLNLFYQRWQAGGVPAAPAAAPATGEPAAEAPAVAASASLLLDDFEAGSPAGAAGWEANRGEEQPTVLECAPSSDAVAQGQAALHLSFDVPSASWATCTLFYDQAQDWRGTNGLRLQLRADQTEIPFSVLVFSGTPEAAETYIAYQTSPAASVDAWAPLELTWEEFVRVAWEEDAGSPFDPAEPVQGMGFGLDGLESGANTGSLWVDDLQLVGVVTPGEPPTAEALPVEAPQAESPEAKGSGLPCLGGAALAPVAVVWVWRGRRTRARGPSDQ